MQEDRASMTSDGNGIQRATDQALGTWKQLFERSELAVTLGAADDRTLIAANAAFARMHGRSVEEFAGMPITEVFAARAHAALPEHIRRANGSPHYSFESWHIRADGSEFPAQIEVTPIRDERGNLLFRAVQVRDITAPKQAEAKLHEALRLSKGAADAAHMGTWHLDVATDRLECSDEFLAILGIDHASWGGNGQALEALVHPEDIERRRQVRADSMAHGHPMDIEFRIRRPDGELRWLHSRGDFATDANGARGSFYGVTVDVTERRRIQDELKESEERYRSLVELSPDAIIVHQEGLNVYINEAALRLFKARTREQLVGKTVTGLVHPSFLPTAHMRNEKILRGERVPLAETKALCLDGSTCDVEVTACPVSYCGKPAIQSIYRDISARKWAEDALRDREARLRLAVEAAGVGVFTQRFDAHSSEADNTTLAFFGFQPGEWRGDAESIFARILPEDRPAVERATTWAIEQRMPYRSEFRVKQPDGTVRWLMGLGRIEYDAQGLPLLMRGVNLDISERKRAETQLNLLKETLEQRVVERTAQLAEAIKFNREVIESVQEGVQVYDREGRFLVWNRFMEQMSGYPAERVLGKRAVDVFPFLRDVPLEEWLERAWRGEFVEAPDIAYEVPETGAKGWNYSRFAPLRDAGGEIVGVIETTHDISARKQADAALRESEERYRNLVELSPDGILVSQDGIIVFINQAGVLLYGASSVEDMLGLSVYDFLDPSFVKRSTERSRKVLMDGQPIPYAETRLRKLDGAWIDIEVTASRVTFRGKLSIQATYRDISERKRAEQQLKAQQAELERLQQRLVIGHTVDAIAHELNQPLNAVASYADAALRLWRAGNAQPDKLVHALEGSASQAHRAGQTMRNLLALLHAREAVPEATDLVATVLRAMGAFSAAAVRVYPVSLDAPADLPPVLAAPMHVEKVLLNLLRNAAEAMHQAKTAQARIHVSVQRARQGDFLQTSVRDFGPGIEASLAPKIFEPFYTTKETGVGIGLRISRSLVEAQGGKLWLDADIRPGACFHFTLPLAP